MSSYSLSTSSTDYPDLTYFGKTLNGTTVLVYDNSLFYKIQGHNIIKYCDKVKKVEIYQNLVVVLFDQGNWTESLDLIVLKENFSDLKKVFVKDKAFNIDDINNYLKYSNRTIKDFYISDGELFVVFKDKYNDISSSSVSLSSFSSDVSSSSISESSESQTSSSSQSNSSQSSSSNSSNSSSSESSSSFSSNSSSSESSSSSSSSSSESSSSSSSSESSSSSSSISSESFSSESSSSESSSSFSEVINLLMTPDNNVIGVGPYYLQV